jgi:hypothetical protein
VEHAFLLKVFTDEKIGCSTGLDFLTSIPMNTISELDFWNKQVTTFRLQGQQLVTSLLEIPDLNSCFAFARVRLLKLLKQIIYIINHFII